MYTEYLRTVDEFDRVVVVSVTLLRMMGKYFSDKFISYYIYKYYQTNLLFW